MVKFNSFLAASTGTTIAVVFTTITVFVFMVSMFLLFWVDVKKKTLKDLRKAIADGFMSFFGKIHDFFTANTAVKTVYSDKSLNYSGTEFLPVPTKAPTDKYTYEFVGWDKNGVDSNGNTVVRAIYLQKVTRCCINVFDDDKQTLIKSAEVEYGAGINLDDVKLSKPDTKEFSYEFIGWDKDIDAFYKHENVYAVYKAIPKKYTYTFLDEDEKTVLNQGTAVYGTPIVAPAAPKKENTKQSVYEFAGWKGYEDGMSLTKDMTFIASFNSVPVTSTKNSSIIQTEGESFKVVSETPVKERPQTAVSFGEKQEARGDAITSINPKTKGILAGRRSGSSVVVELNNKTDAEKFQEINRGDVFDNGDDEVHQKIQLMTIKKTTGDAAKKTKVIKSVPKNKEVNVVDENEIFGNMMVNKVKIDKKDD